MLIFFASCFLSYFLDLWPICITTYKVINADSSEIHVVFKKGGLRLLKDTIGNLTLKQNFGDSRRRIVPWFLGRLQCFCFNYFARTLLKNRCSQFYFWSNQSQKLESFKAIQPTWAIFGSILLFLLKSKKGNPFWSMKIYNFFKKLAV